MPLPQDAIEPATLVLRCVICTQPVPKKRASGRSRDTCSPECHAALRKFKKHLLRVSKCPSCYHPSTIEERKEFMQWRKARGDRRAQLGRPPQTALRKGLMSAIQLLKMARDPDNWPAAFRDELESKTHEFQKLIDSGVIKQSTLPASAETA